MPVKESPVELMTPPEHWPPLSHERPAAGYGKPLPLGQRAVPLGQSPGPAVEQGPTLPRQFAFLLAEVLAGMRPERQIAPWLTKRGSLHLHRLLPLLSTGHQPRVLRVLATRPSPNVVEMTMIAVIGPRHRALAARLEHSVQLARWQCTDIESA